jgi:hypothetical protein
VSTWEEQGLGEYLAHWWASAVAYDAHRDRVLAAIGGSGGATILLTYRFESPAPAPPSQSLNPYDSDGASHGVDNSSGSGDTGDDRTDSGGGDIVDFRLPTPSERGGGGGGGGGVLDGLP